MTYKESIDVLYKLHGCKDAKEFEGETGFDISNSHQYWKGPSSNFYVNIGFTDSFYKSLTKLSKMSVKATVSEDDLYEQYKKKLKYKLGQIRKLEDMKAASIMYLKGKMSELYSINEDIISDEDFDFQDYSLVTFLGIVYSYYGTLADNKITIYENSYYNRNFIDDVNTVYLHYFGTGVESITGFLSKNLKTR